MAGKQYFGAPDPDFPAEVKNEARVKLQELLPAEDSSAIYEYDFGDGWPHKLVLEKVRPYKEGDPLPRYLVVSAPVRPRIAGASAATSISWRPSAIPSIQSMGN
ncbi:IS1096 element passenger TnpR family protein [Nitrococcus mobilis]|uniref:Plasmid pRiA4b Orf3-like domain-containing protein n=1 Tax=Nitrococcus mobilis Nb-231 TaxID=314278 RepID=A4BUI6_9GAMM|nr:hypothetical protein NB231_02248 [Nitrococcus mobilis Nb-231]